MRGTWTTVAIPTLGESPHLPKLLDDLLEQGGFDELIVMDDREDAQPIEFLNTPNVRIWSRALNPGESFYEWWNRAWSHAMRKALRHDVPSQVVLLNDDIEIPEDFVGRLVWALRSEDDVWCAYPDWRLALEHDDLADQIAWDKTNSNPINDMRRAARSGMPAPFTAPRLTQTHGTYKHGGMWGCAFALRAEILDNPLPSIDTQFKIWCGDDDLVKQIELAGKKVCRVEGLALKHHASTTWLQHPELHQMSWDDVERFKAKYGDDSW